MIIYDNIAITLVEMESCFLRFSNSRWYPNIVRLCDANFTLSQCTPCCAVLFVFTLSAKCLSECLLSGQRLCHLRCSFCSQVGKLEQVVTSYMGIQVCCVVFFFFYATIFKLIHHIGLPVLLYCVYSALPPPPKEWNTDKKVHSAHSAMEQTIQKHQELVELLTQLLKYINVLEAIMLMNCVSRSNRSSWIFVK